MSVRARIALGTLCTFNAVVLSVVGVISLRYVDGVPGPVGAALFWFGAAALLVLARRLRRPVEWG